mgnify:CR=1 FL=1
MSRLSCAPSRAPSTVSELPAVEKISNSQKEDPFHVLIATLLSARTRTPRRLGRPPGCSQWRGRPAPWRSLRVKQIERLIYPVSFYRHKARHVTRHVPDDRRAIRRTCAGDDGGVADAAGRRAKDGQPRVDPGLRKRAQHLRRHPRSPDFEPSGMVRTRTPEETEQALYRATPCRFWPHINLYLVTWGQNVCRPVFRAARNASRAPCCPRIGVTRESMDRRIRELLTLKSASLKSQ